MNKYNLIRLKTNLYINKHKNLFKNVPDESIEELIQLIYDIDNCINNDRTIFAICEYSSVRKYYSLFYITKEYDIKRIDNIKYLENILGMYKTKRKNSKYEYYFISDSNIETAINKLFLLVKNITDNNIKIKYLL